MPEIQYNVGSMISGPVDELSMVLVKIPCTEVFRVTDTYANQIQVGHQIFMKYGDSKKLAQAIIPELASLLKAEELELEQLHEELKSLGEEADELKSDILKRAQPILDYAVSKGTIRYDEGNTILYSLDLEDGDLDDTVDLAYLALATSTEEPRPDEDAIKSYIQTGEPDNPTIDWLATNLNPIYGKSNEYADVEAEMQKMEQNGYKMMEQALVQTIDAIKAGDEYQDEVTVGDTRINVKEELRQFIGAEPGSYFLMTIDDVVVGIKSAVSFDGLIEPFQYRGIKGRSIPEELKHHYMSVASFGNIITLFDRAIAKMLIVYARENQEIKEISKSYSSQAILVSDGLFVRALFPEDHEPILTLYSDARLKIAKDESGVRMMEILRNERAKIPGRAAEYFGIPEEQIRLEELISLQSQLMPLLPMQVYVGVETDVRMQSLKMQPRRFRNKQGDKELIMLQARYSANNRRLQRDFNVNKDGIAKRKEAARVEAINLFGEEFGFVKDIELKEGDE